MKQYTARDYEALFEEATGDQALEDVRNKNVAWFVTRTIRAGNQVECETYPVWNTRAEKRKAREATKKQREAQRKVNERNFRKRILRRANASFTEQDLFVTLTYKGAVPDEARAKRDIQNFIGSIKRWRRRRGLPPMQYIYVIEFDDGSGTRKRVHFHMLLTGMDRDALEALWKKGIANSKRLQPDEHGLARVVHYMLKAKKATRRCRCSRNITEPTVTESRYRISAKKVERLAMGLEGIADEVYGRAYPGHRLLGLTVKRSQYVAGAYLYAQLRDERGKG